MTTSQASGTSVVFHQGALGDWVLTFPLLRGLLTWGPVVAVTSPGKIELAAQVLGQGATNCQHALTGMSAERPEFARLYQQGAHDRIASDVRDLFAAATRVVSFTSSGHDAWSANVAALAPHAQRAFVQPRPPADWGSHITHWHRQQLASQRLAIPEVAVPPRENCGGPIVLHPGSGGRGKCWPVDRFERLVAAAADRGCRVVVMLGEVEQARWSSADLARWRDRYEVHEPTTLAGLASWLAGASLYVGNDSGPTHLAAQLGVRTLALFGPTSPACWSPIGPMVQVLAPQRPAPMDWLAVDHVVAAALDDC